MGECFKGADRGLGGGSGLNDFCIYRTRYNTKHCIASKPIEFLFDGKGVCPRPELMLLYKLFSGRCIMQSIMHIADYVIIVLRHQTPTAFYVPSHANSKTKGTHNVEGVMEKDKVIDTENSSSQSSDMLSELLAWSAWLTSVGHPPSDILLQIFDFLRLRTLDPPILSSLLLPQLTSPESQPLPGFKVLGAVTIAMALP